MFGINLEPFLATIEIYIGDTLSESKQLQAPVFVLQQQYVSLVQQIANDTRPMKVCMYIDKEIYDDNNNFIRKFKNGVEFENKLYGG